MERYTICLQIAGYVSLPVIGKLIIKQAPDVSEVVCSDAFSVDGVGCLFLA